VVSPGPELRRSKLGPCWRRALGRGIEFNVEKGSRLLGLGPKPFEERVLRGPSRELGRGTGAEVLLRMGVPRWVYRGLRLVAIHEGKWRGVCAASG